MDDRRPAFAKTLQARRLPPSLASLQTSTSPRRPRRRAHRPTRRWPSLKSSRRRPSSSWPPCQSRMVLSGSAAGRDNYKDTARRYLDMPARHSPAPPLAPLEFLQNQRRGSITDPSLHAANLNPSPTAPSQSQAQAAGASPNSSSSTSAQFRQQTFRCLPARTTHP